MLRSASRNNSVWTLREAKVAGKPTVCYVVASGAHYDREESMMRESVIVFCVMPAAAMLLGATLFASSRAQAMPLAGSSGLKSAIYEANATQKVGYICRRGSYGRRCYYVSRPDRNVRYARPYANGAYRFYTPQLPYDRYPYDPYYWASGARR
jgi:hypothetical protein